MVPIPLISKDKLASESLLKELYQNNQALYSSQVPQVQRFIDAQARLLAEAIVQKLDQVHFLLPDSIIVEGHVLAINPEQRDQHASSLNRLFKTSSLNVLQERLSVLEYTPDPAIAAASRLIRYMTALYMVYQVLPSGRTVEYRAVAGEEIPTIPVATTQSGKDVLTKSALVARTDAVTEWDTPENGRGELQVPYVPAARSFYLPQWVAFDDQGNLLTNSMEEAEASLVSMQRFIQVLHDALALAPYIVVDTVYQQKRYGMLGQLINQGRVLALFRTGQIIAEIQHRVAIHDLNRGLSLSLPYFDDQDLEIKFREIEIIPAGRIMFLPTFVVKAMQAEEAMVAQDTRLSPSTRKYLMAELNEIEKTFEGQS